MTKTIQLVLSAGRGVDRRAGESPAAVEFPPAAPPINEVGFPSDRADDPIAITVTKVSSWSWLRLGQVQGTQLSAETVVFGLDEEGGLWKWDTGQNSSPWCPWKGGTALVRAPRLEPVHEPRRKSRNVETPHKDRLAESATVSCMPFAQEPTRIHKDRLADSATTSCVLWLFSFGYRGPIKSYFRIAESAGTRCPDNLR